MTYYEGQSMYECQIDGVEDDVTGNNTYICSSDDIATKQCASTGETKFGLQISIPLDNTRNLDDICVDNLWIDDDIIDVEGSQNFIGDGDGGAEFINYRYFDLGSQYYIPSEVSGATVPGLPRCMWSLLSLSCDTHYILILILIR